MPSELPGGMQQRAGLARAFAADPGILLMDEPFSALDLLIRSGLQDEFLALPRTMNKTTIVITHDLDEAIRMGSSIAIMKDGEVVRTGVPEHIVTNPADDYVADFVKGISRLELVFAHTIMEPPERYERAHGGGLADADTWPPPIRRRTSTRWWTSLSARTGRSRSAPGDGGRIVGVVTKDALLRGIRGET